MPARWDDAWFARVVDKANTDHELAAIGRHFTADVAIVIDDDRRDFLIREGRITQVRTVHRIDSRVDFGFRAPAAVWEQFLQDHPPPLYHSVFALLMRVPEFKLDGDGLVFAQNARAMTRLLSIMQSEGALA